MVTEIDNLSNVDSGRRGRRPDFAARQEHDAVVLYSWLAENGVDEWLPEKPRIAVGAGQLTYTAYVWLDGKRGWDGDFIARSGLGADVVVATEDRVVPLLVPLTDQVRMLARRDLITLVEYAPDGFWVPFDRGRSETAPAEELWGQPLWLADNGRLIGLGTFDGRTFRVCDSVDGCPVTHWAEVVYPGPPAPGRSA